MKKLTLLFLISLAFLSIQAQWNPNTDINTLVSNSETEDIQSVVGSNNKTYIVYWVTSSTTNYELRLQILDADGHQELGSNGALISNSIPMGSFTMQWSLTIDESNNIYVGVTGTNNYEGFVFKLDAQGNNQWGSDGLNVGTAYVVRVLPLKSGDVMISWLNGSTYSGDLQKFSSEGNPIWANPVSIASSSVSANMYELSDASVLSVYHVLGSGINSTLYAQRFDTNGASMWANPTQLFANGNATAYNALYYGVQDNDVVYYSYKLAHNNRFDAYVQRINPDGSLPWGITGSDFDVNQTNYEQEIQIGLVSGSSNLWALCRYTNTNQDQQGIYVQKFDKNDGSRLLTDNAKVVYPLGITGPAADFRVTANDEPIFISSTNTSLDINLLDENGDFVWTEESKPIASFNAQKGRLNLSPKSNTASYVLTFTEDKGSGYRAYAQNFIVDESSVSVKTLDKASSFTYNNPVQTSLRIHGRGHELIKTVAVYNSLGQEILSKPVNTNTLDIDTHTWESGIYFVKINTEAGLGETLKIIKN